MNIIEIPLKNNILSNGYVLGYDGENLTTEIRVIPAEIIKGAEYHLEFNNGEGLILNANKDYLSAVLKAEVLTVGDIDAQLVWSWKERQNGEEVTLTDKSNVAHWRVLDSIELSRDIEKAYPDILAQILADIADIKEYGGGGGTGRPGVDGEDGFSPEVIVEAVEGGYTLTITNKDAEPTVVTIYHGKDGKDGKDGVDGKDGQDGYTPQKGVDYFDGKDGKDGYTPQKDVDYFDGKDGKDGVDGKDGKDYVVTEADYQAIAAHVLTLIEDGDTLSY